MAMNKEKILKSSSLPLSVAVITLNEADNLPRLFDSLKSLNPAEIVVVDAGSTDDTVKIAKAHAARVIETDWPGHVMQKNRALHACEQSWVLFLDADEPISVELAESLKALFASGYLDKDGYEISRRTWYMGDWLRHTWYPEWRLRLIRKGTAQWEGLDPHDRLEVAGSVGRLAGDILHYSYRDIEDHFHRSITYARIGAKSLAARGKPFRGHKIVLAPLVRFFRILIIQQGWRDGWRGWIIAWSSMFTGFLKYAFLYEIRRQQRKEPRRPNKIDY